MYINLGIHIRDIRYFIIIDIIIFINHISIIAIVSDFSGFLTSTQRK